jgi:hypothetical protein
MTTAETVLAQAEKMKYGDWFDAECIHHNTQKQGI